MTITFEDIKKAKQVMPFSMAYKLLQETEPLTEHEFPTTKKSAVTFEVPSTWNSPEIGIQEKAPDYVTPATVALANGPKVNLTKEALLTATSSIGLNPTFSQKSPGPLVQAALNYWANHGGMGTSDRMKLLVNKKNEGVAFVRPTLNLFSNLMLVEKIADRLKARFGVDSDDLWVDYKMQNSLNATSVRLIVPEVVKTISTARHGAEKPDDWSLGIQFTNSLSGASKSPLSVSGYLFAWWCTNGAVSNHAASGNYSRKTGGQDMEEVLDWISSSTDQIFDILPEELDDIESLTSISLSGELNDTISDIFEHYKVPTGARQGIMDQLVESNDLTGYGLMNSITQAANDAKMPDNVAAHVMRIGGAMPHVLATRCDHCHRLQD